MQIMAAKCSPGTYQKTTGKLVTLRDVLNISAKLCYRATDLQVILD